LRLILDAGGIMSKKRKMRGRVQKVIKPVRSEEPEKVEIRIDEAEELYREVRIENTVTDERGGKSALKEGATVDVILEADSNDTEKKSE
jgi:hypothetical protein